MSDRQEKIAWQILSKCGDAGFGFTAVDAAAAWIIKLQDALRQAIVHPGLDAAQFFIDPDYGLDDTET